MPDLLIELFSEEIPARMQARAAEDLKRMITNGLVEAGLTYAGAESFATPRRLTLAIDGLLAESPAVREERKGPKVGAPEKALEGFLRSTGLARDDLEARETPKGAIWFATIDRPGRPAADIVSETLTQTIRNFPWPKSMRWGAGSLRWVRPLHAILCILTDEAGTSVVPVEIDGITSGNTASGHRFLSPGSFQVSSFEDYAAKLKRAHVVLSAAERAEHIRADAESLTFAQGLELVDDPGLLAEVAGLVEWPVVLIGAIGDEFLDLPPDVLQTSMREHQKFFSVRNPSTGRIEKFITVANTETADQGATILAGNQKVLAARLSDAKFFWENDLRVAKAGMGEWLRALSNVTFHAKLGTQAERIERIAALARELAPVVGADPDQAEQAARIAKADLASEMVYEFPELQGVMGRYYAEAAGYPPEVAAAARAHYSPLGPSDDVPTEPVSVAVALADKIDTLTGFWAIDEKPTGSKDPYALRRAALGVIRLVDGVQFEGGLGYLLLSSFKRIAAFRETLVSLESNELEQKIEKLRSQENQTEVPIAELEHRLHELEDERILLSLFSVHDDYKESLIAANLLSFLHDRLKVHLRDEGIRHDVIDAVLAMPNADDLTLLVKRARALQAVLSTDDGENLVQGFKRANNILTQAEEKDGVEYSFGPDPKLAEDDAERALFAALDAAQSQIGKALESDDFEAAMATMAGLRGPIDRFFESVQVNAENQIVRRNRLNLLHRIREICGQVADLTRIEG